MAHTGVNPAFSPDQEEFQQVMADGSNQMAINMDEKGSGGSKFTSEEERILEVLREVVRKCTNSDPSKRPTAAEVLEMLNKCPVSVK